MEKKTRVAEAPQISTQEPQVDSCAADSETTLKKYQREPKAARCRLVPQWMAETVLKNGATPLCFNLCEDGTFSISIELNGEVAPLTKEQFRELWPNNVPQSPETPQTVNNTAATEKTQQNANKGANPTCKQSSHVRKSRTTESISFSRPHENGRRVRGRLDDAANSPPYW